MIFGFDVYIEAGPFGVHELPLVLANIVRLWIARLFWSFPKRSFAFARSFAWDQKI